MFFDKCDLYEKALIILIDCDKETLDKLFEFLLKLKELFGDSVLSITFNDIFSHILDDDPNSVDIFKNLWYYTIANIITEALQVKFFFVSRVFQLILLVIELIFYLIYGILDLTIV